MNLLQHSSRAILLGGIGILLAGSIGVGLVILSGMGTESLADLYTVDETILYLRSNEKEWAVSIIKPFGLSLQDFAQTEIPTEGWFEYALVRDSSSQGTVAIVMASGNGKLSSGSISLKERRHSPPNPPLSRTSGMQFLVENEKREILWYSSDVLLTGDVDSMLKTTLFGGTGILILPEKGGKAGRAYVDGAHLQRGGSAFPVNVDAILSLSLSRPGVLLEMWLQSLKLSHVELGEGIHGIIQERIKDLEPDDRSPIGEKPMRIDWLRGKDGIMHFLILGTSRGMTAKELAARFGNARSGSARTIVDGKGVAIRKDIIASNPAATPDMMIGDWTVTESPYSSVTDSPLFLAAKEGVWFASDDKDLLITQLEIADDPSKTTPSASTLRLHLDMQGGRNEFDLLLPSIAGRVFDRVKELIGENIRSIDLSVESMGNGFLVRWILQRTSDESSASTPPPEEALAK